MIKQTLLFSLVTFCLAACATTNPPGPEGTGEHKAGYYLGRSDAVKQQYWLLIHQQQRNTAPDNVRFYEIPVPEQTMDGVILQPTTKYLRIEE